MNVAGSHAPLSSRTRVRDVARSCARDAVASVSAVLGVGVVACVACCALPLLLAAGGLTSLAAGAGSIAGAIEPHLAIAVAALALAVPIGIGARRVLGRDRPIARPAGACAVDGSCGCSTGALACSLAPGEIAPRAGQLRDVFAAHTGTERDAEALTLRFRGEALERVRALAASERACCAFLESDVRLDGTEVRWTLRGPAGSEPALAWALAQASLARAGSASRVLEDEPWMTSPRSGRARAVPPTSAAPARPCGSRPRSPR